jgi:2-hydroxychromene-2-carboxylate isomerase
MKELNFYFDYLSPFSYFAWLRLPQMAQELGLKIHYKPVALGPLLNHWGIKGPGEVQPKREFLLKQMLRYADTKKIEFTTPKTHPFNSLYALRLSLLEVAGSHQERVIEAIWKAGWQKRIDLGEPDELQSALREADLPAEELFEKSFSREAKVALKNNIQEAITKGVFGVPSFVYQDELFWGNDSMNELKFFIQGEDNLDRDKFQVLLTSTPRAASQSL